MTVNKRTPTEGETLLLRILAEIREAMGAGDKPMLADLPGVVRDELARLRRVVVAYIAWEALGQQAKAEWSEAKETPRECLEWLAEINKAKAELNAALLDSGMPIPEELRRELEAEREDA